MSDETENVISLRPRGGLQPPPLPPPGPPPLPPGPRHQPLKLPAPPTVSDSRGDDETSVLPSLPAVAEMRPPLPTLPVPSGPLLPEPAANEDEEEGAFVPPGPEDPDNPTVRDTLAVAVALMTALGVAAAQAMWQRARHRQALADKARGGADTSTRSATTGSGGAKTTRGAGGPGSAGSLLRSPGGDSKKDKGKDKGARAFPRRPGGGGDGSGPPGRGKDPKGPKATRGGKTDRKGRDKPGRTKNGPGKDGLGTRLRRGAGAADRGLKKLKRTKSAPGKPAPDKAPGSPRRRLTWKAPKPGSGKTSDRKRWARTGKDGSSKRRSGFRGGFRSGVAWLKRWRASRTGADETPSTTTTTEETAEETETTAETFEAAAEETWTPKTPPPPPGFGGMRPPPGADRRTWVTVERVDGRARPRPEAAALTVGQTTLPAGTADAPAADTPPPPPPAPQKGPFMSTPVRTTQYADAELTIHDVIDADADMAAEIADGVVDAQATAEGCERLLTKLEALHAEVVELKVPGVLEGLMVLLMEKTATVKARAEAIAETLPAAAEAISVAGSNAEARHRPLADAVRDAGHTRPAEREYHDE